MENENLEQNEVVETKPSPLHTVTPLSKYLALVLFVAMPFIGGWIGYKYTPEKIVEIDKIVEIEKQLTTYTIESRPFEKIDKRFYTLDINPPSGYWNTVFVLEDETLFWNTNLGEGWSSTTVSEPENLEYIADGILSDGRQVYTSWPLVGSEVLIPEDGVRVLAENNAVDLIINGQKVYGLHSAYSNPTLSKEPIITSSPESVEIAGGRYFKDSENVYYVQFFDKITIVDGANPATFQALESGFAADQDSVFYATEELEGIGPESVTFTTERGYRFMIAGDRVWGPSGQCGLPDYKEIPLSEIDTFTHC